MGTNAMGREAANPGKGFKDSGRTGSNADRDRAASASLGASRGGRDRPTRTAHTDFITPKYNWGDARMRDFSIIGGGLRGLLDTIMSGNTYAGRMPIGFANHGIRGGGGGVGAGGPLSPTGPTTPRPPMAAPVTPQAPMTPLANLSTGPMSLGVPGPSPYGLNIPGYSWVR